MRSVELVKVHFKKTDDLSNYAALETVCSLLHEFESKKNLPVFDILKILISRKVDSLSFTKDNPHFYFYSRLDDDGVLIKFDDLNREVEISMTTEALRTMIEATKSP